MTRTKPGGARAATVSLTSAKAGAGATSRARASKRDHMGDSSAGAASADVGSILVKFKRQIGGFKAGARPGSEVHFSRAAGHPGVARHSLAGAQAAQDRARRRSAKQAVWRQD